MIKIIDNKKIELSNDEWAMYERIVLSYTKPPYQKGEDFFIDLFETDDDGLIIFLKPPTQRQISLEIFLFLMCVMQHQHLRNMYKHIENLSKQLNEKIDSDLKTKNISV
jgi:hypothetical protein